MRRRDGALHRPMLFAVVALAAFSIWPAWISLAQVWGQVDDYSHGYLIVAAAVVWLALGCREPVPTAPNPSYLAHGLLCACIMPWLIAWKGGIATGMQVLTPLVLWLAVWATFGWPAAKRLAAPFAFLYFAIPVWELIVPLLQHLTVAVTEASLALLGVPARIDGVFVTIPEGRFVVEEGCSGRHFLVVSLAVSSLLIGVWSLRGWRAVALLATTVFLALLANWVRVVIVVHAGHASHMQSYLVAREHVSLGWLIFAVLLALVYMAGARLAGPGPQRKVVSHDDVASGGSAPRWSSAAGAIVILCVPLLAIHYAGSGTLATAGPPIALPGVEDGRWQGPVSPGMSWTPRYPGASSQRRAAYRALDGTVLEVFVAEYATQRQSAELINYANSLGGEGWTALHAGMLDVDSEALRTHVVEHRAGARRLIAFLYQVGAVTTTSAARVELTYGVRSWIRPTPVRVIAMALPCEALCEEERKHIAFFWKNARPSLLRGLENRP